MHKTHKVHAGQAFQENRNCSDSDKEKFRFGKMESELVAGRIREVIGDEYIASFGRRCGLSEAVLRSYINDYRMPPLDKSAAIAAAGNVSIDWLATGRGPRERSTADAPQSAPEGDAGEIAHIYSVASPSDKAAFKALAHAVVNRTLRAWIDVGVAIGATASIAETDKPQTQKKEP